MGTTEDCGVLSGVQCNFVSIHTERDPSSVPFSLAEAPRLL